MGEFIKMVGKGKPYVAAISIPEVKSKDHAVMIVGKVKLDGIFEVIESKQEKVPPHWQLREELKNTWLMELEDKYSIGDFEGVKVFEVKGYWKDDKSEFDGSLICTHDDAPVNMQDEDIFFYGMSVEDMESSSPDDGLDFVITHFKPYRI